MNVLAVGLGEEQVNAIKYAQSIGLYVVGIDRSGHLPGASIVDKFYEIDLKDEETILQVAQENQIAFIIPTPIGSLLTTIGRVNDELNLRGVSHYLATLLTNKEAFYNYLIERGLYVPGREIVKRPNFQSVKDKLKLLNLPCIIKPSKGSGSRGVIMISESGDIDYSIQYALDELYTDESIIIEEFVSGQEYGVDFRIEKNQITILSIRKKNMTDIPYRQEVGYLSHLSLYQFEDRLKDQLNLFFNNYEGIEDCIGNLDVIITNELVYFVEMSLRPAGLGIMYNYLTRLIGFNPVHNIIDVMTERDHYKQPSLSEDYVAMYFINLPKGTLLTAPSEEEIMAFSYVVECRLNLSIGDFITEVKSGKDIINRGYIIMQGPDCLTMDFQKQEILNKFIVDRN